MSLFIFEVTQGCGCVETFQRRLVLGDVVSRVGLSRLQLSHRRDACAQCEMPRPVPRAKQMNLDRSLVVQASKLVGVRTQAGLGRGELAALVSRPDAVLEKLERDGGTVPMALMARLCEALRCEPKQLVPDR